MVAEDKYSKYMFRVFFHLFDLGFFYLLLIVFFSFFLSIWVFSVFCTYFFYYIFNRFQEAIVYTDSIKYEYDSLSIEYFKYDNGLFNKHILKKNLEYKWYDSVKGSIKAPRLVIEVDDEVVFTQYAIGKWNKEKLLEVYNKFYLFN